MTKSKKNTSNLIIPDDALSYKVKKDRRDRDADFSKKIKKYLQDAGFSNDDQKWLIDLFNNDLNHSSALRHAFTYSPFPPIVEKLGEPVKTEKDRQTRLALLFGLLIRYVWFRPEDVGEFHEWVGKFQRYAKFRAQSLDWDKLVERTYSGREPFLLFEDLVPFLCPEGVPLNQIVDLDRLNTNQPAEFSGQDNNYFRDPQQLQFWLIHRFEGLIRRLEGDQKHWVTIPLDTLIRLDTLLQPFSEFSEDVLGEKILGLLEDLDYAMRVYPGLKLGAGWRVVAHELVPFLDLLTAKEPDSSRERSSLLKAWWHLAKVIYSRDMGRLESELSAELKNRLVESAARHIGILRSVLRDTPEVFEGGDSAGTVSDFYQEAFYILLNFAPPWKCLKPLLLAFTGMTVQAVTSDLRAWPEVGKEEKLPYPYSCVALWVAMTMYPQNLQGELDGDPYLQELREEFAKFCLERLKTKGKQKASSGDKQFSDKDFVEPRPLWRRGYVQALAALRVNPGGRAHRTLFWLSQNDPNETTRALAQRAHKQIRHLDRKKPNLDVGASPRRPLFEAFWWLRQAHLLTLKIEINQAGAMGTRRRELHRTREKDDRRNWGRTK